MSHHLKTTALAAVMGLGALAITPAMGYANGLAVILASPRGNSNAIRLVHRSPRRVRPNTGGDLMLLTRPRDPRPPRGFAAPSRIVPSCYANGISYCIPPWISPWNCVLDPSQPSC